MKIFIVILNFNGRKFILQCLESVRKLSCRAGSGFARETGNCPAEQDLALPEKLEIIVIDNASTDGSDREVEKNYKDVKLIRNKENLGFAEGNNVGIKYALENGADYVLILNPDTLVNGDLVIQLIKVTESDTQIGIAGPKIYFAPGYEYHKDRYKESERGKVIFYAGGKIDWQNVLASHRGVDEVDKGQYDEVGGTDFATGCAMLVKRQVLEKIGVFDPKYFLYWEDSDLCQRTKRAGYKVIYVSGGKVWHLDAGSSKVGGSLHDYYLTRNRLLFGMRYAPMRAKLALLRESVNLLFTGRRWQKIGILDFYRQKFGRGSYVP